MKKVAILVLCLACFNTFVLAEELYPSNSQKKHNKVIIFFKKVFKKDEVNFTEIHELALNKSLTFLNNASYQNTKGEDCSLQNIFNLLTKEEEEINKLNAVYSKNPNNIKNNKKFYDTLNLYIENIEIMKVLYENQVIKEAYSVYYNFYVTTIKNTTSYKTSDEIRGRIGTNYFWDYNCFETYIMDSNKLYSKIYTKIINDINLWKQLKEQIYQYSYNYEKNKYNNWFNKNHKKRFANITLDSFIYHPKYVTPQTGYLYTFVPGRDFYLKVMQTVPGGVILSGNYIGAYAPLPENIIYLQTSKQFADNSYIREPIVTEYKGLYEYYTVLGVKKRIYKFYRLGESEIKKNFEIPGQPFYFYRPY